MFRMGVWSGSIRISEVLLYIVTCICHVHGDLISWSLSPSHDVRPSDFAESHPHQIAASKCMENGSSSCTKNCIKLYCVCV